MSAEHANTIRPSEYFVEGDAGAPEGLYALRFLVPVPEHPLFDRVAEHISRIPQEVTEHKLTVGVAAVLSVAGAVAIGTAAAVYNRHK